MLQCFRACFVCGTPGRRTPENDADYGFDQVRQKGWTQQEHEMSRLIRQASCNRRGRMGSRAATGVAQPGRRPTRSEAQQAKKAFTFLGRHVTDRGGLSLHSKGGAGGALELSPSISRLIVHLLSLIGRGKGVAVVSADGKAVDLDGRPYVLRDPSCGKDRSGVDLKRSRAARIAPR
jgi:hypothetical protein